MKPEVRSLLFSNITCPKVILFRYNVRESISQGSKTTLKRISRMPLAVRDTSTEDRGDILSYLKPAEDLVHTAINNLDADLAVYVLDTLLLQMNHLLDTYYVNELERTIMLQVQELVEEIFPV